MDFSFFHRFWGNYFGTDEAPVEENVSLAFDEKFADAYWHRFDNTTEHRTRNYNNSTLVLRRGQPFKFTAKLNRPFDPSTDKIKLQLRFGSNPDLRLGTEIIAETIPENNTWTPSWFLEIEENDESPIVTVHSPPDALIGRYKVAIYIESVIDGVKHHALDNEPDIILICNPWCENDTVYLENENDRDEYVLNDHGAIWRGSVSSSAPCNWNFGQFEEGILDATLHVLKMDARLQTPRGLNKLRDPVWLGRILSAVANSSNEGGILSGAWNGEWKDDDGNLIDGCTRPTSWSGSVKIIKQFMETGEPVKYGQCWVFSGLLTTLMRSIGIPARSVTNFASAHDTENTMTIDKFISEANEPLDGFSDDSVWNFHVWNEIWVKGTGHWPAEYSGWAAIDATPQESSNGLMQCGPAPLAAIKKGHIYIGYDTGFVFAEVNADRVEWIVKQEGSYNYIKGVGNHKTRAVGFNISTKSIGSYRREVLDNDYKWPEGSEEEREAWQTAFNFSSVPDYFSSHLARESEGKTVSISIEKNSGDYNGLDVNLKVRIFNISDADVTCDINTVVNSTFYDGKKHKFVTQDVQNDVTIGTGEELVFDVPVEFIKYYEARAPDDFNSMSCNVVVKCNDTQKSICDSLDFNMPNQTENPHIQIENDTVEVNQEVTATITFTNPLQIPLTNLVLNLEGSGLNFPEATFSIADELGPDESIEHVVTFSSSRTGSRNLIVDIDSNEQPDFQNSAVITCN